MVYRGTEASMPGYANRFRTAYPAEGVSERAVAKALAAFQRTIVVADSPFDRWLAGDRKALSLQAWRGYQVFVDPKKGNCAARWALPSSSRKRRRNRRESTRTGRKKPGRQATQRSPSGDSPPPGTMPWTWG